MILQSIFLIRVWYGWQEWTCGLGFTLLLLCLLCVNGVLPLSYAGLDAIILVHEGGKTGWGCWPTSRSYSFTCSSTTVLKTVLLPVYSGWGCNLPSNENLIAHLLPRFWRQASFAKGSRILIITLAHCLRSHFLCFAFAYSIAWLLRFSFVSGFWWKHFHINWWNRKQVLMRSAYVHFPIEMHLSSEP